MLVKQSIVEKWYQRDSWVFKNFSYLFQNPLWNKRVPAGFSVCPYFWLSLFSFAIFHPLVFVVTNIIGPIGRLLGKPFVVVDDWCKSLLGKVGIKTDIDPNGIHILLTILMAIVTFAVVLLAIVFVKWLIGIYAALEGFMLGLYGFWGAVSFGITLSTIGIHKLITKTDCKTMSYMWVWMALFIVGGLVFVPTELLQYAWVIVCGIGGFLSWLFVDILWYGIKVSAVWLAKMMWMWLCFTPIEFLKLPWWTYFFVLAGLGWVFGKLVDRYNMGLVFEENKSDVEARFRKSWVNLFLRTVLTCKNYRNGAPFEWGSVLSEDEQVACLGMRDDLYEAALERMFAKKLDILKKNYPSLKDGSWHRVKSGDSMNQKFYALNESLLLPNEDITISFEADDFYDSLKYLYKNDFFAQIKESAAIVKAEREKAEARRRNRKNGWSHQMCLKVTTAISEGVHTIWKGIKWTASQSWTFLVYLWILVKAKKQGVCPYFMFTDATTNKAEVQKNS